jgi:hypothetical protein
MALSHCSHLYICIHTHTHTQTHTHTHVLDIYVSHTAHTHIFKFSTGCSTSENLVCDSPPPYGQKGGGGGGGGKEAAGTGLVYSSADAAEEYLRAVRENKTINSSNKEQVVVFPEFAHTQTHSHKHTHTNTHTHA